MQGCICFHAVFGPLELETLIALENFHPLVGHMNYQTLIHPQLPLEQFALDELQNQIVHEETHGYFGPVAHQDPFGAVENHKHVAALEDHVPVVLEVIHSHSGSRQHHVRAGFGKPYIQVVLLEFQIQLVLGQAQNCSDLGKHDVLSEGPEHQIPVAVAECQIFVRPEIQTDHADFLCGHTPVDSEQSPNQMVVLEEHQTVNQQQAAMYEVQRTQAVALEEHQTLSAMDEMCQTRAVESDER